MEKQISHLLDTNILSDLIRNPQGAVSKRIRDLGENRVSTSLIVAAEIRYGCLRKGSKNLTKQAETILNALTILPLEHGLDKVYARIRFDLETKGQPIGPNDLLIAAHAVGLNLTLVTANAKEFSRVPDLRTENWLKSQKA